MQATLARSVGFSGFGLHSGAPVRMRVDPAPAGHGVVFVRTDLPADRNRIPARMAFWTEAVLCTRLENAEGASVSTIEHMMAALAGMGVHNACVRIDGPEVPILDGSAAPFLRRFQAAGLRAQSAPLEIIRILRPIEVRSGPALARLEPADAFSMRFEIDFPDRAIGHQMQDLDLPGDAFDSLLANARTFCRRAEVEAMQAAGRALGGSYENAVVFDGDRVLSPGGLRYSDEPVRHKMLDAMGDLALAGAPILGRYLGVRAGHALTGRLLQALLADPDSHRREICSRSCRHGLPGAPFPVAELALTA